MSLDTKLVQLSPPEVHYALALATQRDACKQNRANRWSKQYTGFGVHFAGVVGELCFRRVYEGRINTEVLPNGDNHSADVVLPDGRAVEMKSSLFQGEHVDLIFEDDELGAFTHCSLVQVILPDQGLVFPIWTREWIVSRLKRKSFGHGQRYVYSPHEHDQPEDQNPF